MRDGYHFDVHGTQRIYVTRLGPFGIVVLGLLIELGQARRLQRLCVSTWISSDGEVSLAVEREAISCDRQPG
jgi:hypothetical protein